MPLTPTPSAASTHSTRRSQPRILSSAAATLATVVCIMSSVAAPAAADTPAVAKPFTSYDVSQQGIQPPQQVDKSTSYLVIGLNPILGQKIVVSLAAKSSSSTSTTSSTTQTKGNTSSNAAYPDTAACANAAVNKSPNLDALCTQAYDTVNTTLSSNVGDFQGESAADLQQKAGNDVATKLALFSTKSVSQDKPNVTYADSFYSQTSIQTAEDVYARFIGSIDFSAGADITHFNTAAGTKLISDSLQQTSIIEQAMSSIHTPSDSYTAAKKLNASFISTLQSASVSATEQEANLLVNQMAQIQTTPQQTYYYVVANCQDLGFSSISGSVKETQTFGAASASSPTTVWESDVSCYPTLSVGAMYYASTLNTNSYVLTSIPNPSGSGTVNVAKQVSNNVDQGSFSGALNYCWGDGGNSPCGVLTIGSGTSGLNGGLGVGGLFVHRIIGAFVGLRIGQTTVLDTQYTAGVTPVPSGATYTHSKLGIGGFVGISLNIPSK